MRPVAALATLATILAIVDVALLQQWIRLGRQAASTERAVDDTRDELGDVRARLAAARGSTPPTAAMEPPKPAPARPSADTPEPDPARPPRDEPTKVVAGTPEPVPAAPAGSDSEPEDAGPAEPTPREPALAARVKGADIQARLDRLLRASLEGEITLVRPVEDGESFAVRLSGPADFLGLRVVAEQPTSWRIEHEYPDSSDTPKRVASIARRGTALMLTVESSPRAELLRYVALELQRSAPTDVTVTIPLGAPYRAAFEVTPAERPRPKTLRPPLEVTLFRDRLAGMRLARACAADPSLVPVIEGNGVVQRRPSATGGDRTGFSVEIPTGPPEAGPGPLDGRPAPSAQPLVIHFTRSREQIEDRDEFRCMFAGVLVTLPAGISPAAVVVEPGNARQLEAGFRTQEARILQSVNQGPFRGSQERDGAVRTGASYREAGNAIAAAAGRLRDLPLADLTQASIRVTLCRPGAPGEIVIIEPLEDSPAPSPR